MWLADADNNTDVAFENALFSTCKAEIDDVFINEANYIYITIPMYNLIEYSDNYSDRWGGLWQFKRDGVPADNADLSSNNSQSFKYKAALVGMTRNVTGGNSFLENSKAVVALKYLRKFCRLLQMPLINCKIRLELNWIGN